MKKSFYVFVTVLLLGTLLCSCGDNATVQENSSGTEVSMFIKIEQTAHWLVVYHRETKVMYVVSNDDYTQGIFTVLVDENGDPMIYGGK